MSNSECLSWDNRNVGTKDIPTDIPDRQTPVRGVVTRKSKVIFDEVFFVNTEDLEGDSNDGYLTLEPKESSINPSASINFVSCIQSDPSNR